MFRSICFESSFFNYWNFFTKDRGKQLWHSPRRNSVHNPYAIVRPQTTRIYDGFNVMNSNRKFSIHSIIWCAKKEELDWSFVDVYKQWRIEGVVCIPKKIFWFFLRFQTQPIWWKKVHPHLAYEAISRDIVHLFTQLNDIHVCHEKWCVSCKRNIISSFYFCDVELSTAIEIVDIARFITKSYL